MKNEPFFSILLPTRNNAEYIGGAIQTILNQDFDDYELIVSNNNSDDNTEEVVKSFKSDKLVYVETKKVYPLDRNWNFALFYAKGKYILMIGDDDGVTKFGLKKLKEEIISNNFPDLISQPLVRYHFDENLICFNKMPYEKVNTVKEGFEKVLEGEGVVEANVHTIFKRKILKSSKLYSMPSPDFVAILKLLHWSKSIYYSDTYAIIHGYTKKSSGQTFALKDLDEIKKQSKDFKEMVSNLVPFSIAFYRNAYYASMRKALQELGIKRDIDWRRYFNLYYSHLFIMKYYGNNIKDDLEQFYKELKNQPLNIQLKVKIRIILLHIKYMLKKPTTSVTKKDLCINGEKYGIKNIVDLSNKLNEKLISTIKNDIKNNNT